MKKIDAKDLVNDKNLLEKMYEFYLVSYWNMKKSDIPLENYIYNLKANDFKKVIYYIEEDNEIISYLECEKLANDKYYVSCISTNTKYRKSGYAKRLINEMIDDLSSLGDSEITIHVSKNKKWLKEYYEKLGFVTQDELEQYVLKFNLTKQ